MNRGNLAEDPKAGLTSSSRYSRMGGEKNSLLYVDSSSLRKEKKAAERKNGKQSSSVKGDQKSNRNRSVGHSLADSHMDRLEVGSDGRLFQVKESSSSRYSDSNSSESNALLFDRRKSKAKKSRVAKTKAEKIKTIEAKSAAAKAAETKSGAAESAIAESAANESKSVKSVPAESKTVESGAAISTTAESKIAESTTAESKIAESTTAEATPTESKIAESKTIESKTAELNITPTANTHPHSMNSESVAVIRPAITSGTAGTVARSKRAYQAADFRNPLIPVAAAKESFIHRYRSPILAATLAVVTAGYIYTGWHYRNRFYPGTEFFGISAAEQSVYDVKAAVKDKVDSYSLNVIAREPEKKQIIPGITADSDNVIMAEEVGLAYQDNGEIDRAMKNQKSWAWPVMMIAQALDKEQSALQTYYDSDMVSDAVSSLECMQEDNMIPPQDAKVVMTDNGAEVQPEIYGTTLDKEKTEAAVRKALDAGDTSISLDGLGLYKNPEVYAGDISLMSKAMALNTVLGAKITMHFGDQTEIINSKVIRGFLGKRDGSYYVNEERVRKYIAKLAAKYDTYQKEREFFTSIGTSVTLEEGIGDYGWELDQEATFEEVLAAINDKKVTTINPTYTHEGYYQGANDIGDTYVEVSLTNQTMWFYKDGKLIVETPVVTGNPYAGNETPSGGIWRLKGKMRNQCLVGQGYNSPVDYWMPFNQGVGIHDLQGRGWYGGTIYMGGGSHGCVNTPLAAVKLIYTYIEEGVPVIVYKDESEEALAQVTDPVDSQSINTIIEETYGTVEDDGIGSIVSWTTAARVQQQAQAQAAASAGTSAAGGSTVTAS